MEDRSFPRDGGDAVVSVEYDSRIKVSSTAVLADYIRVSKYAKHLLNERRRENWPEQVARKFDMHDTRYGKLLDPIRSYVDQARSMMLDQRALGSQRVLQFGGAPILKLNQRVYNCTVSHCNRPRFFQEAFHLLLCGCGVGFSVQKHHVARLPKVSAPSGEEVVYQIPDSIEGWADSYGVLLSSYFQRDQPFPEFAGKRVVFDGSLIRPKGSKISSGSNAPGPEPLLRALESARLVLDMVVGAAGSLVGQRVLSDELTVDVVGLGLDQLRPIHAFDLTMFAADAVLSGGVRRSATIATFSADDIEMIEAKASPGWYDYEPQRKRANISAVLLRGSTPKSVFDDIIERTKMWGEPGFLWTDDLEIVFNPCAEIGMWPCLEVCAAEGDSSWGTMVSLAKEYGLLPGSTSGVEFRNGSYRLPGWQMCNLATMNGSKCRTPEMFYEACQAASTLSTLQAGYTRFDYLGPVSEHIVKKEALLGVSMTGMMDQPDVLFDPDVLEHGAQVVKDTNEVVARAIGINTAARSTCVKPEGKSSLVLNTLAAGIHPWPSKRGIRHVRASMLEAPFQHFKIENGHAVYKLPKSDPNHGNTEVIAFPFEAPEGALTNDNVSALELLQKVVLVRRHWIEPGTRPERCTRSWLRHNVSNTITVGDDEWDSVSEFIFANRDHFSGVAMLPKSGDKFYNLAPNVSVRTPDEMLELYGIDTLTCVRTVHATMPNTFSDLWEACGVAVNGLVNHGGDLGLLWVDVFKTLADTCFDGDLRKAEVAVKDVECYDRYVKLCEGYTVVDWTTMDEEKDSVEWVGGMDGACDGQKCTFNFESMGASPSK